MVFKTNRLWDFVKLHNRAWLTITHHTRILPMDTIVHTPAIVVTLS